jgi:hypothetical protein
LKYKRNNLVITPLQSVEMKEPKSDESQNSKNPSHATQETKPIGQQLWAEASLCLALWAPRVICTEANYLPFVGPCVILFSKLSVVITLHAHLGLPSQKPPLDLCSKETSPRTPFPSLKIPTHHLGSQSPSRSTALGVSCLWATVSDLTGGAAECSL